MTFDGFDFTSFNQIKHTFPSLDKHVSVENGIYYLSLIEQFVQLRARFADHLDAFHARAELRYELWIRGCQHRQDNPLAVIIPPIDVAYMSHAHLVSPFRYYEDCQRMMPHMLMCPMPLQQLYAQRNKPSEESIAFWAEKCAKGAEPFVLTLDDLKSELPGYRECPLCKKCFKLVGLDYGKWRTDPTVYLKCWFCEQQFNVHDAAIEQILNDLMRERHPNEKDVAWIRGTMLNNRGTLKKSVSETGSESITQRLKRIITHYSQSRHPQGSTSPSSSTTASSSSRAMSEFIENSVRRKTTCMYDIEPILLRQLHFRALEQEYTVAEEKQKQKKIKGKSKCLPTIEELNELIDLAYAMNACYGNNPSPFSLDLIQAAERQHMSNLRLVKFPWSIPDGLVLGIRHYKNFILAMRYEFMDDVSVEIDLAWQIHMLFPEDYRHFSLKHTGRVINHEDLIPHYSLEEDNEDEQDTRRFSNPWIVKGKHHKQSSRVHPRPSLGSDYIHGTIVVDDPIDSISLYSDHCHSYHVDPSHPLKNEFTPEFLYSTEIENRSGMTAARRYTGYYSNSSGDYSTDTGERQSCDTSKSFFS